MPIPQAGARNAADTPSIDPDTRIHPVAEPVNTYVQPAAIPKNPLFGLAQALEEFDSSLSPIIAREQQKQDQADAVQAQAEFLKNNEEGYSEAVRTGAIPASASPTFVRSYKEMEGRRIARDAEASLFENYQTSGLSQNEDPTAFSPWISGQVQGALNGVTDPDVLKGAMPQLQSTVSRLGLSHAKAVGNLVMQKAIAGVGSDIVGAISDSETVPTVDAEGKLIKWAGVTDKIDAAVQNGRAIGIPEDKLQKMAVDAITTKAIESRDVDLLGNLPPDIAKSLYAEKEIAKAHDEIVVKTYQDERRADADHARQAKADHSDATRNVIQVLTADPNGDIPEDILQRGEQSDPQFRLRVEDMRNKIRANAVRVDPQVESQASLRINTSQNPVDQAVKEVQAGNISGQHVSSVLYSAQRLKQSMDRGQDSILKSAATRQFDKALRAKFGKLNWESGRVEYDEEGYGRALVDYHSALADWESDNPNAKAVDRMKATREIGEEALKAHGASGTPDASRPSGGIGNEGSVPKASTPTPAATSQQSKAAPAPSVPPGISVSPTLSTDPVERARQANPALRSVPDSVIRRYLPDAEREAGKTEKHGALEPSGDAALVQPASFTPADAEDSEATAELGSVSAKYESGGRGVGFISSGYKDPGGPSYGVHQLASASSMRDFVVSPEAEQYADDFAGLTPGTAAFNRVYKRVAARDPEGLAAAEKAYYTRTHYEPVLRHAAGLGFDTQDRGVQEALFSISVQHGGAKRIVSRAARMAGATPQEQIKALYAARTRYVRGVRLPAETRAGVLNRYRHEVHDALALAST
jgi:hypothetical protein